MGLIATDIFLTELLRGVVESVLMTPKPDGYAVRIALKRIDPATQEGDGADVYQGSCGGPIGSPSKTDGDALPFRTAIRRTSRG